MPPELVLVVELAKISVERDLPMLEQCVLGTHLLVRFLMPVIDEVIAHVAGLHKLTLISAGSVSFNESTVSLKLSWPN